MTAWVIHVARSRTRQCPVDLSKRTGPGTAADWRDVPDADSESAAPLLARALYDAVRRSKVFSAICCRDLRWRMPERSSLLERQRGPRPSLHPASLRSG